MAKLNIKAENENGTIKSVSGNKNIEITFNIGNKRIATYILTPQGIDKDETLCHLCGSNEIAGGWCLNPTCAEYKRYEPKTIKQQCPHFRTSLKDFGKCLDCGEIVKGKKQQGEKCPACGLKPDNFGRCNCVNSDAY